MGGPIAPQRPPARIVDLEDDGLPAQTPPERRLRLAEDDPSEPWSPNYGREPGETRAINIPDDEPAAEVLPWSTAEGVVSHGGEGS